MRQDIKESSAYLQSVVLSGADEVIITGTGMKEFEKLIKDQIHISFSDIPHFPTTTVKNHNGKLIFGYLGNRPILLMSGRLHYYEGYSMNAVTYPINVFHQLGIKHAIFLNAVGSVNPHLQVGDIVLVDDHINLLPENPLRGQRDNENGTRFINMIDAYDSDTINSFLHIGKSLNYRISTGVYLALQGPSLETRAEYRMAHILGADLVGMSTIPEVIQAKYLGMKVNTLSVVSNTCFPTNTIQCTNIEEIEKNVSESMPKVSRLMERYFSQKY